MNADTSVGICFCLSVFVCGFFEAAHAAEVRSLDGAWKIATDPTNRGKQEKWFASGPISEARDCRVPDVLETTFPGYDGVAWYWKSFDAPDGRNERLLLKFHAADYLAEVWVNGELVGSHEGGETPFSFDVTKHVRGGPGNRLVVRVVNPGRERVDGMVLHETPHGIKNVPMTVGNFWNPGGIWQSVELLRVPRVRVGDLFVTARRSDHVIRAQVQVANETGQPVNARLSIEVAPAAGGPVLILERQEGRVSSGGGSFTFGPKLGTIHEWSVDDPYLYRVTARVESPEGADVQSAQTGFRDFVFHDGYFRLNGKRIFLKGTHSVGHFPIGQHVPHDPELLRRELIYVKTMGFNTVRWLGRTMFPSQLDLCDELGLMVYEESYASWGWRNPPEGEMKRRFDFSVREMILRDRSHPSVTIWGLLNETMANAVHRHAVEMLPLVRSVDTTRMVLLSSGRWDGEWSIGSLSNPGTSEWTPSLGAEALGAAPVAQEHPGGYTKDAGDAHMYVPRPWRAEDLHFFRTTGAGMKNVFLSEYGNGSQIDPIRIIRLMEENGAQHDFDDYKLYRAMYDQLERDWKRWGLDEVFASPSDMVIAGQRLQSEQRLIALNAIRSNPHLAGYSLTGLSDQAIEGEGLMTTFRELKPDIVDVMTDGFAPVRWSLFAEPPHVYRGAFVHLEAVLANEDALKPGAYPVRIKVSGPGGSVFEKAASLNIPDPRGSPEPPMVFPAFKEDVKIDGPAGQYQVEVSFDRDAAAIGRQVVVVGDAAKLPTSNVNLSVLDRGGLASWLSQHGAQVGPSIGSGVILIGSGESAGADVMTRVNAGSVVVLLEPRALPDGLKGKVVDSAPLYWGRDDIVRSHPIFEGLPARRLMDLRFYRDVIAQSSITDFAEDAENVVPTFAVGRPGGPGYWAGSNLLIYKYGEGRVIVSTLRLLENLGKHPVADRIVLNMVSYAAQSLGKSEPRSKQTLMVPMRDGVRLATDEYRAAEGGKAPVLLMRTPYNKAAVQSTAEKYAAAGYNVVVQDTRGRFESEGAFYPYNNEGQDGYDTLDWIQKQPWSDGRVGMWGASYVGAVQWQAAAEHSPGLAVLAPTATWSSFYRNVYLGGTVRLALIAQAGAGLEPRPASVAVAPIDWSSTLLHLPLANMDTTIGWAMPWLRGILTHPRPDGFWKRLDITAEVAQVNLPAQHVVGYYDFFCREVVANFQRTRQAMSQLILGPWDHGTIGKTQVGDVEFGPNARFDLASENLIWFDRFLKGGRGEFPRVRYFSMGDNVWHQAGAWPPANTTTTSFYLHSDGHANTRSGTGTLSMDAPRAEMADTFEADPANPVPAVAAINGRKRFEAIWGPVDQGPVEDRKDVLVYSTAPLQHGMRFAGPLKAELAISATTPDADWVVKVIDVRPDGFAQNLAVGIERSSARESELNPVPLEPGRGYRINVDLGHAAAWIAAGHELRIEITGSYFPLYERNTNTGEGPFSGRILVARQTLEHATGAASRILIPVIEGEP